MYLHFLQTLIPQFQEKHQIIYSFKPDNKKSEMRSFKSNENIHKKEGGSYYVVSANKASSVTLQSNVWS